jgi:hypothetical protein
VATTVLFEQRRMCLRIDRQPICACVRSFCSGVRLRECVALSARPSAASQVRPLQWENQGDVGKRPVAASHERPLTGFQSSISEPFHEVCRRNVRLCGGSILA